MARVIPLPIKKRLHMLEEQIAHAQVEDTRCFFLSSGLTQITEALRLPALALEDSGAKEAESLRLLRKACQESEAFVAEISERASALEASPLRQRYCLPESFAAVLIFLRHCALDVKSKRKSPLAEKLVADAATASLVSGRLPNILRFSHLRPCRAAWEKIFPRL